jgi:hemerythrin-like domain-containing protein
LLHGLGSASSSADALSQIGTGSEAHESVIGHAVRGCGARKRPSSATELPRRSVISAGLRPVRLPQEERKMSKDVDRRHIVRLTGLSAFGLGAVAGGTRFVAPALAQNAGNQPAQMEDVTPPEDLMREHGVLNRVLLIYEAAMRRFSRGESFDPSVISRSADIIRRFIEDYHERNEENQVFPRFRKAGKLVDLVNVLYQQHQAGRRATDTILQLAPNSAKPGDDRNKLIATMQAFIRMYRPHEAREDTVLFPALRSVVTANEFDSMADDFEKDEKQKFGQDGFEAIVSQVDGLERAIGIEDLRKFTPT